jgi:D-alanyl-D-alanine carboxypeptidase
MGAQLVPCRSRSGAILALATLLLATPTTFVVADERADALDKAIPAALQRTAIPGAIIGVWQDGRAPYVRTFGVRDVATGAPMATDLSMRIGSNSKAFTVTALLMLADQGRLGLDDPVGRYVEGVPGGETITLRQLAQMRSGLPNYADDTYKDMPREPAREWTPRELLDVAFKHPPEFAPGTAFDYSNTNTLLLGLVVEKVSGRTLESVVDGSILKPLRLMRTVFPVRGEMPEPHSKGYFKMPDGRFVDATDWNPSWGWAAGSMISTLDDMRTWTRALALGELLSPAMLRERDGFLPAPAEGEGAQYGLAIENQKGWIGHNGNIFSYMVYPYYLPAERITLVVMLNTGADIPGSWAMMQDITRIVSPSHPWPELPKQ